MMITFDMGMAIAAIALLAVVLLTKFVVTTRRRVEYVDGIPNWFTYLLHLYSRQRCRRQGHATTSLCTHCGEIQREPT